MELQEDQKEEHRRDLQVGHRGYVLHLLAVMLLVDEWVSKPCCSGEGEVVGIDLDVVFLFLVSQCVRVRVRVGPALLAAAVMRVAYVAPRAHALGRSPMGRGVDCSWQIAALKLAESSYDKRILVVIIYRSFNVIYCTMVPIQMNC